MVDIMFHLMQLRCMTLDEYLRTSDDTADALAARVGMSKASMSRTRKGKQNLSMDTIAAIVRETKGKVTADDLLIAREAA